MIFNPVVQSGSSAVTYHVENDQYNTFYPTEARPGQYVFTTSGTIYGSAWIYDETESYRIADARSVIRIESLPPKIQEALETIPSTLAPPMGGTGYYYFVMPEENVKIVTGG